MRLALLLVIGAVAIPRASSGQSGTKGTEPVIDMHLHAFDMAASARFDPPYDQGRYQEEVFAALARYNVVAVASGPANVVEEWRRALPERIIPGLTIWDPRDYDLDSLRAMHRRGELAVIGEVGAVYEGFAPNHPALEPLWALAAELDIPVAIHLGMGPPGIAASSAYRYRNNNPLLLEDVLARHPTLRVYVMHAGWPFADEMVAMMQAYPGLHVELSITAMRRPETHGEYRSYLRRLVEAGYVDRMMFGSDQMVWPERIGEALAALDAVDFLDHQQRRAILHDNAARFLRLDVR